MLRILPALATLSIAYATDCPALPPTAFTLPDVLSVKDSDEHGNGMLVNHGIDFVDVNGDGLSDLVWGYGDTFVGETTHYACIYLNTACGWGAWGMRGTTSRLQVLPTAALQHPLQFSRPPTLAP